MTTPTTRPPSESESPPHGCCRRVQARPNHTDTAAAALRSPPVLTARARRRRAVRVWPGTRASRGSGKRDGGRGRGPAGGGGVTVRGGVEPGAVGPRLPRRQSYPQCHFARRRRRPALQPAPRRTRESSPRPATPATSLARRRLRTSRRLVPAGPDCHRARASAGFAGMRHSARATAAWLAPFCGRLGPGCRSAVASAPLPARVAMASWLLASSAGAAHSAGRRGLGLRIPPVPRQQSQH
jgi:hypothetical protein